MSLQQLFFVQRQTSTPNWSSPTDLNSKRPALNDLVSLPLIISDFDGSVGAAVALSAPDTTSDDQSALHGKINLPASHTETTASTWTSYGTLLEPSNWGSTAAELADGLWAGARDGLRRTVRGACLEVLRRTEEPWQREVEASFVDWNDDARLLD